MPEINNPNASSPETRRIEVLSSLLPEEVSPTTGTEELDAIEQAETNNVNTTPLNLASRSFQMKSIKEIQEKLRQRIPDRLVRTSVQGGTRIKYLDWQTVVRYLDLYAPGWEGNTLSTVPVGNGVAVTYEIGIPCAEGIVVRSNVGYEEFTERGYGDAVVNAQRTAQKRTAADFGLGLYLYDK